MKIRNQFLVSIIAFIIILGIIAALLTFTMQQTTSLNGQAEIALGIQTGASDLSYSSNNFFLYQRNSDVELWQSTYSKLSNDLLKLNPADTKQQTLFNNIQDDLQRLDSVFLEVVSFLENAPSNVDVRVSPEFQTAWNRMAVQNQALAFDAQQLAQTFRSQVDQMNQTNIILIIALLGLFGAYFITNYLVTYRRTVKSISDLQAGIAVIGSGNLDHALKTDAKDEMGEVSESINLMAVNLKTVTASKSALEKEIEEHKKAERALRKSEERWSITLSSIGDAVIATDTSGKIMFMNCEAEELTGWKLSEASQKPTKTVFNIINEQTRLEVESPIDRVLREGLVVGLANHTVLIKKDGEEVPIDDSGAPIKDIEGNTTGVVLVFRDITERKKAEIALKESEERYRHLVKYAPTGIYEIDFIGPRFISVNDAMCVMSGYTREELLAKNPFDLLAPESQIRFKQRIAKALAGENIAENVEYMVIAKGGQELWAILNVKLVSRNGRFCGAQVVAHDITERKKTEDALRQNEQTFLELIERSPFGIYIVNSQFRIEHMNKGSQNGAFRNVRPIIGRDFSEAMHILWPETTAWEIISHFRHTLETGEPYYSPPFVNPRRDVEIVEAYEWELQRIKLPNGQYGVICYYFDSTKLRETERKLSEAQAELTEYAANLEHLVEERTKQLKSAERLAAIGATAGMVGHDIRNPLQAITSDVFLAKSELASIPDSQEKKNALESMVEIEKNIDYINKIVQDLQDFARPLNPKIEETDFKSIVETFIAQNGLPKNVNVSVNIADDARKLRADSHYLNRILFNLVTNAVQAMPNGGKLTISAHKEANDTILAVKDTGVGIPQEIRDKMFTLMFTTKSKGQGFGLPVVKRMTESLGGTVTFESQEGKGTTFIVRLPPKS